MSVVDLTEERQKRTKPSQPKLGEARYYCTACSQDHFHVMSTGEVRCAGCSARMKNIMAADVPLG